jgi:hypothetical protein
MFVPPQKKAYPALSAASIISATSARKSFAGVGRAKGQARLVVRREAGKVESRRWVTAQATGPERD